MSWQPVDCHAHTTLSDGALTPERLVERVRARGVRPSIADHVSTDIALGIHTAQGVRSYLDAIEPLEVYRGAEFCWHDSLWRELPDDIMCRFTHRIGSLHAVVLRDGTWIHAFTSRYPANLPIADYMDAYIRTLEQFAREAPVEILAHPTLLNGATRRLPVDEVWSEEIEQRVVDALFRSGIAFEISARYRPHERLVRRAVDRGVRVALGSDGHREDQIGAVEGPLALARSLGVADGELYDPDVHGRR
jgi:histidinol phosphatase-like PHP family hydrolase